MPYLHSGAAVKHRNVHDQVGVVHDYHQHGHYGKYYPESVVGACAGIVAVDAEQVDASAYYPYEERDANVHHYLRHILSAQGIEYVDEAPQLHLAGVDYAEPKQYPVGGDDAYGNGEGAAQGEVLHLEAPHKEYYYICHVGYAQYRAQAEQKEGQEYKPGTRGLLEGEVERIYGCEDNKAQHTAAVQLPGEHRHRPLDNQERGGKEHGDGAQEVEPLIDVNQHHGYCRVQCHSGGEGKERILNPQVSRRYGKPGVACDRLHRAGEVGEHSPGCGC